MDFPDKIRLIRSGVPAQHVGELALIMDMPKQVLIKSLGLSRSNINRRTQYARTLSPGESERVLGMQMLIGQVQAMINLENSPNFDAAKWLSNWLLSPLPALGGAAPASYLDTVEALKGT
uniref:antitoxin Xre-like helix-turn-helix domain-containing protein n=1 Tax=Herbaspirillum sp. C7C2 TaxID=2736666 RepID=UPI00313AE125